MIKNLDFALILIRVFGIGCFALGAFGTVYAVAVLMLWLSGVAGEFANSLWQEAASSLVTGPYWMLLGAVLLVLSPRLARWAVKLCNRAAP